MISLPVPRRPAISDGGDMWREQCAQLGVSKRNLARVRGCCTPFVSSSRGAYASRISDGGCSSGGPATNGDAAHRLHRRKRAASAWRCAVAAGGRTACPEELHVAPRRRSASYLRRRELRGSATVTVAWPGRARRTATRSVVPPPPPWCLEEDRPYSG